jgi:hypothetical protein
MQSTDTTVFFFTPLLFGTTTDILKTARLHSYRRLVKAPWHTSVVGLTRHHFW